MISNHSFTLSLGCRMDHFHGKKTWTATWHSVNERFEIILPTFPLQPQIVRVRRVRKVEVEPNISTLYLLEQMRTSSANLSMFRNSHVIEEEQQKRDSKVGAKKH